MKPSDYTLYRAQLGLAVQAPENRRRRRLIRRRRFVRLREYLPGLLTTALILTLAAFATALFI